MKQSSFSFHAFLDCFAALVMTAMFQSLARVVIAIL